MNEQTTLERALEMMALLSRRFGSTVEELADYFEVSQRTVRRYLRTIKEAGYVVVCREGKYHIDKVRTKQKLTLDIGDLLYFSKEEARILNAAIGTIETTNVVKEALVKKLYALYDDEKVVWKITRSEDTEPVKILIDAIRNHHQVIVMEYDYSSANRGIMELIVEPLGFAFNFSRIWAYVPHFRKNLVMRLSGMAGLKATGKPFLHTNKHKTGFTDPFRGYGFEKKPVKLLMDLRAYGLMVDEFPLTRDFTQRTAQGKYELETGVCNFREIGRFILGLPSNILEIEPPELKEYISDRHRAGLDEKYNPGDKDGFYEVRRLWEF